MTQEHPITPPPELVTEWWNKCNALAPDLIGQFATQAARWGADQELDACCEWIYKLMDRGLEWSMDLRASRRPKPPSLKEQAIEILGLTQKGYGFAEVDLDVIRRALESLPD